MVWPGLEPETSPSRSGCAITEPKCTRYIYKFVFCLFIESWLSDLSYYENLFPCTIAQFWYNSFYHYGILFYIVDEFWFLTFWIVMYFKVDPDPKDPYLPVKMWRIRTSFRKSCFQSLSFVIDINYEIHKYSIVIIYEM